MGNDLQNGKCPVEHGRLSIHLSLPLGISKASFMPTPGAKIVSFSFEQNLLLSGGIYFFAFIKAFLSLYLTEIVNILSMVASILVLVVPCKSGGSQLEQKI